MELYFAPLACSLAARIAAYEAGLPLRYREVDNRAKRVLDDGSDFTAVNPMGQVPVLRTDDGTPLTENVAVLQWVADRAPPGRLAPRDGIERAKLQQWLAFISTELHKASFVPLLDPKADEGAKAYASAKLPLRMGVLEARLCDHDFLLDAFSVADSYLVTVLNWARFLKQGFTPGVAAYYERLTKRPAIARALAEEFQLYADEQARLARAP